MAKKAKQDDPVTAAREALERWQDEVTRLEAERDRARSEADGAEHARSEAAFEAHTSGAGEAATATLVEARTKATELTGRADELESALKLARLRLTEAEQEVTRAERAAVAEMAKAAHRDVHEKRQAVHEAIAALAAAVGELSDAARRAAGCDAFLFERTYSARMVLDGKAGAPNTHYQRHLQGPELVGRLHVALRGYFKGYWPR